MMQFSSQTKWIWLPVVIGIAASLWLLTSLGNGMLWQDEAQTALLARTTLRTGLPIAFDGANSISQEMGDDYGPHGIWKWHMWLPFYVLAGFFKVFGESTAVARLPFALFGVATVILAYYTALSLWRDVKTAVLTSVLLLVCVPFALVVRQCRYYSPAMFFSLLMLYAYIRICQGWRRGWILLAVAATLDFNCHFIYTATAFAAMGVHLVVWHREKWRQLLLAAITTGVLCTPPTLWLASLNYRNYSHGVINPHFLKFQLKTYVKLLGKQVLPYPIVLIPIAACIGSAVKRKQIIPSIAEIEPWALPFLFGFFTVFAIAPFSPWPFFRYLGPLIAPLMMITARWIVVAFRTNWVLGAGLIVFLALWWPDSEYLSELQHRFVGPTEGIVQLLRDRGKPGDVVVTPYEDLPLKFYTTYRVVGGLTGESLDAAKGARWMIPRRKQVSPHETAIRRFIYDQVTNNPDYHPITLGVSDTPYENREEPKEHLYRTVIGMPPVTVFELRPPAR